MSDEKTMLPELLPVPKPVIPSLTPRERVVKHWHTLMTTGAATAALAGCGCLVMDPIPQPAQCRTTRSVLSALTFNTRTLPTGAVVLTVTSNDFGPGLAFLSIDGGRASSVPAGELNLPADLTFIPSAAAPMTVIFTTTCEGTAATSLKVVLTPQGLVDGGTDAGPTGWLVNATDL
jgi:hypothetical protein